MSRTRIWTKSTLLFLGLLFVGLILGCGIQTVSSEIEGEVQAAIMPNANLVFYYNLNAIRNTPISESFKEMGQAAGSIGQDMQGQDYNRMREQFKEVTGLEDDDFGSFILAANFANIDFDAPEPPAFSELDMLLAVGLNKAVSGAQVVEFMELMAAEQGQEANISETIYSGTTIYTISDADQAVQPGAGDVSMDQISMAMIGNDKVCLIGSTPSLQAAIDRVVAESMADLSPEMKEIRNTIPAGAQAFAVFTMTPAMKQMAVQEAEQVSPNDPMAAFNQALGALQGASLSMQMGRTAEFNLTGFFEDSESAAGMTAFFDNMLIATVRMFAGMMLGPRPLPLLQSLNASHEANQSVLSFTVSEEDVQTLQEIAVEGAEGAMQF